MNRRCAAEVAAEPTVRCPRTGSRGRPVARATVESLLTDEARARLSRHDYRFCPDERCPVVYYDATGAAFLVDDVRVPVRQKLPIGARPVCYCFDESEATIHAEVAATGRSAAVERVRARIADGRCACVTKNPLGTCCLGDVAAAVARAEGRAPD